MVEKITQALERAYQERANPEKSVAELLVNAPTYHIDADRLMDNRIITSQGGDGVAESYSLLGAQVRSKLDANNLVSLGITSANAAEGKTLTAINLAISLARTAKQNIILVDGDLKRPSIHERLNILPKFGLIDVFKGTADISDIIIRSSIVNLWVVPGRSKAGQTLDQGYPARIQPLFKNLLDRRRNILIVDLPPVLESDIANVMATNLDGIILVVENDETKNVEVLRSVALLEQANLIGSVLNKVNRLK